MPCQWGSMLGDGGKGMVLKDFIWSSLKDASGNRSMQHAQMADNCETEKHVKSEHGSKETYAWVLTGLL